MGLDAPTDWIAWAGIVLPLITLAWAAAKYVQVEAGKAKRQRFEDFKSLCMDLQTDMLLPQVAAVYEMRKYPEYSEVIGRMLRKVEIGGSAAKLLTDEMDITLEKLKLKPREQ